MQLSIVEQWIDSTSSGGPAEHDAKLFWFIVALVEIGELRLARRLLESFKPDDLRYLLAIHLGCYLTEEVRAVADKEKKEAHEVCKDLSKKIEPLRAQVMKEFGSQLLEIRRGEIKAIESK